MHSAFNSAIFAHRPNKCNEILLISCYIKPSLCVCLCVLCFLRSATVCSGSARNLACGILIPTDGDEELASAARALGLALISPKNWKLAGGMRNASSAVGAMVQRL